MLFERLFPFQFENGGNDCLLIRVDDDDFIVPAGACLSSQGGAIFLTSPGDAAVRAFPVRQTDTQRREPYEGPYRREPPRLRAPARSGSGFSAKILARVTANLP